MGQLKISAEQIKIAAEVAKKLGVNKLYANTKEGEFFTDKNRALLSENNDANAVAELSFVVEETEKLEEGKVVKLSKADIKKLEATATAAKADLGKAQEAFDTAKDKDEVGVNAALAAAKEAFEKADAAFATALENASK